MIRNLSFALAAAAMFAAPAFAEEAAVRAENMPIREGAVVLGHVSDVERDANGRTTSIASADLEAPADAPPAIMAPRRPGAGPAVIIADAGDALHEPASAPRPMPSRAR